MLRNVIAVSLMTACIWSICWPAPACGAGFCSLKPGREARITAAGVSLLAAGRYLVTRTHAPDPGTLSRSDVSGIDRIALELHSRRADTLSDYSVTACTILALLVTVHPLGMRGGDSLCETTANLAMYAETVLLEQGLTTLVKGSVRRSRPYAYDSSAPLDVRRERNAALSFWSGHTASAFSCAVFAGYVFQERNPNSRYRVPVWIGGLSAATMTAVMRVCAGQHFPTDVITGAAAGSFAGWLIPRLHRAGGPAITVVPTVSGEPGLGMCFVF